MRVAEHVQQWFRDNHAKVIEWRRHIHSHPELSHAEYATTDFIVRVLKEHGMEPQRLPNTGVMVDLGPVCEDRLAFRGDIDALPIVEETGLEFSSRTPGVSHACGHDVHTTIMLALACGLATAPLAHGVRVIFQPAEEVLDGGAPEVIAAGALEGVAAIYALHCEPKLRVGKVGLRTGAITSATDIVQVTVTGPGGHSSRPHLTADVIYGIGKVITELPTLLSRRVDPRTGTVLVFGSVNGGFAPNAIPKEATVSGTLRTADIAVWREAEPLIRRLVAEILAPTGCGHTLMYQRGVPPVLNDDVATALLAEAAREVMPQGVSEAPQSSGGEDFSWYLEKVPGSMARLGCWNGKGNPQDLHQGDLLVDEGAIEMGVRMFAEVAERFAR